MTATRRRGSDKAIPQEEKEEHGLDRNSKVKKKRKV